MSAFRESLSELLVRALIAAPFGISGMVLIHIGRPRLAADAVIGGIALLILAFLIVLLPLARLLASPWGSIFSPDEHYRKPLPMYGIPESRRQEGKYEQALVEYQHIIQKHPRETKPYLDMIEIAIVDLGDLTRAFAFYQQGMQAVRTQEERDMLTRMYQATLTRMKPVLPEAKRMIAFRTSRPEAGGTPARDTPDSVPPAGT